MTRWDKLSTVLLRLVDSARGTEGAVKHMTSAFGRMCDTIERIESNEEARHASHQKAIREYQELEARVARLERSGNAAE